MSSYCSVFDSNSFANCLTDLSLSELLILKHSVQRLEGREDLDKGDYSNALHTQCPEETVENCDKPATMALVAAQRGYDVSHPNHDGSSHPPEKASKLQTLFQISITALAFLSFGGYLLCLIVQSIKNKGTTYLHPVSSTMATVSGVKRIKVYRRNRRSTLPPMESTQAYNLYGQHNSYYNTNNPYKYYQP